MFYNKEMIGLGLRFAKPNHERDQDFSNRDETETRPRREVRTSREIENETRRDISQ